MPIRSSQLFEETQKRLHETGSAPDDLWPRFLSLLAVLEQEGKYIVQRFPEYTPHDIGGHIDHLFDLADRVFGKSLYDQLNGSELMLLAVGVAAHDWGMCVSEAEIKAITDNSTNHGFRLLIDESARFAQSITDASSGGLNREDAILDYLRNTHAARSGQRLRAEFESADPQFAEFVARITEGHAETSNIIRNGDRFLHNAALFGQTVNLAAITEYVRIVDLLDIGSDRTPYALWKFVQPANQISSLEWSKHRSLSPVAVGEISPGINQISTFGLTDDVEVYAALEDLHQTVQTYFGDSIAHLNSLASPYRLPLDSRIRWIVQAKGFEPILARFEVNRSAVQELLSNHLYTRGDSWIRELLQNSVDAIDTRKSALESEGLTFEGQITISINEASDAIHLKWTDNGIGMDINVVQHFFGMVGTSWYQSPTYQNLDVAKGPISRFGIGFLSCFAVTDSVHIQTQSDNHIFGPQPGLDIEIPHRDAYFRIRTATEIPIGTSINFSISKKTNLRLSVDRIYSSIKRFSKHVSISISVVSGEDDGPISDRYDFANTIWRDPDLEPAIKEIGFSVDSPDGSSTAHYRALVPVVASQFTRMDIDRFSNDDGTDIVISEFANQFDSGIYVKGILAEPDMLFRGIGSGWFRPQFDLDFSDPAMVSPNLSRERATILDQAVVQSLIVEVVSRLATEYELDSDGPANELAKSLGEMLVFTGAPTSAALQIIGTDSCPLLVMSSGEISWASLSGITSKETFFRAPSEIELSFPSVGGLESDSSWRKWWHFGMVPSACF